MGPRVGPGGPEVKPTLAMEKPRTGVATVSSTGSQFPVQAHVTYELHELKWMHALLA